MKFDDAHELIDYVRDFLIKQGKPATELKVNAYNDESHFCVYRGPNGTKCAVGCLIDDEDYDEIMEGKCAVTIIKEHKSLSWMKPFHYVLEELQTMHDKLGEHKDSGDIFIDCIRRRCDELKDEYNTDGSFKSYED